MSHSFADIEQRVRAWADTARERGWLSDADVQALHAVEVESPTALFEEPDTRPLMIGFFGGTGVGKSSLLNRIAGSDIAKTGVVRPTSHEVTVYLHETCALSQLPADAAEKQVRVERHRNSEWKNVAWVDTPDVDSTDATNRATTLGWLPYLDLLVYVSSPERYRDDSGWQVLQQRTQRHAWIFVINRADEGGPGQVEQFRTMLSDAGFEDPIVLQTCSKADARVAGVTDEFSALRDAVEGLLSIHGAAELEKLRRRTQARELRAALEERAARIGDEEHWSLLQQRWRANWEDVANTLREGVDYSLRYVASRFAVREGNWLGSATKTVRDAVVGAKSDGAASDEESAADSEDVSGNDVRSRMPDAREFSELTNSLWDDWAEGKFVAALDQIELECRSRGVAPQPLRKRLDSLADAINKRVDTKLQDALRAELANPGAAWRRIARKLTGFATVFLPTVALCVALYIAVDRYRRAAVGDAEFLDTRFLVHSGILIALAWAVPFVLDRLLRPSLERGALSALRDGVNDALAEIDASVNSGIEQTEQDAAELRGSAEKIKKALAGLAVRPINIHHEGIRRMIAQAVATKSKSSTVETN